MNIPEIVVDWLLQVYHSLNVPGTLKIGPSYCAASNIYVSNEVTARISHSDVRVVRQVGIQMIQFQQFTVL